MFRQLTFFVGGFYVAPRPVPVAKGNGPVFLKLLRRRNNVPAVNLFQKKNR